MYGGQAEDWEVGVHWPKTIKRFKAETMEPVEWGQDFFWAVIQLDRTTKEAVSQPFRTETRKGIPQNHDTYLRWAQEELLKLKNLVLINAQDTWNQRHKDKAFNLIKDASQTG